MTSYTSQGSDELQFDSQSQPIFSQEEVVAERKICYYSNFDININEWFVEYENIEIFQQNVKKNLGELWLQYLNQVLKQNQIGADNINNDDMESNSQQYLQIIFECFLLEVPSVPDEIVSSLQFNKLMTQSTHITSSVLDQDPLNEITFQGNLQTTQQRFNQLQKFEEFYEQTLSWIQSNNTSIRLEITDYSTFKSLLHTFYYIAMKEMRNINKKRESDERFAIAQLTEKALAKHNQRRSVLSSNDTLPPQYSEASKSTNLSVCTSSKGSKKSYLKYEEKKESSGIITPRGLKNRGSLANYQMSSIIPGFSLIKNKVITPLLVATEKVVDYIINEDKNRNSMECSEELSSVQGSININEQFSNLTITDEEKKRLRKKRRYQQLQRQDSIEEFSVERVVDEELLTKASDCIEFLSKKRRITESITQQFVTNVIELDNNAINQLRNKDATKQTSNEEQQQNEVNLRFIKPSKDFYNKLMALWLRFDKNRLERITFDEFIGQFKKHSSLYSSTTSPQLSQENEISPEQRKPAEYFFSTLKREWQNLLDSQSEFSISTYFNKVKNSLFQRWNFQIIKQSQAFQQQITEEKQQNE